VAQPPEPPRTKAELIDRIRSAYAEFDRVLAEVPDDRLHTPGAAGADWSVRDVIAHVGQPWLAGQLEAALRGELPTALECFGTDEPPPPGTDLTTNDARNAAAYERDRDLSLDHLREREATTRARMLDAVRALPEDEFSVEYTIVEHLNHVGHVRPVQDDEQGWPLARWIAGNAWHHYENHAEQLRAFLEQSRD